MEQLTVKVADATIRPKTLNGLSKPLIAVACGGGNVLFNDIYEKTKVESVQVGVRGQSGSGNVLDDPKAEDFKLQHYFDDLTAVMKAMKTEKSVLFGYSHGGYFTLAYALAYPEKVSSLILLEPAWNVPKGELYARIEVINKQKDSDGSEGISKMLQYVSGDNVTPKIERMSKEIVKDWQGGHTIAAEFKVRADNPITEKQLSTLKVPTLLIYGTKSAMKHTATEAASHIENPLLWGIKGAEHLSLMEDEYSDELSDVITVFLKKHSV